jgi:Uma2 family endonuclease
MDHGAMEIDAMNRPLLPSEPPIPPLKPGDRLTREEFERRYEAMPELKKAELIEGVVHMPSPVRHRRHGRPHGHLGFWLVAYEALTPGVETSDNSTVRLDMGNVPQPDMLLLIDPARGGQARISDDDYIEMAPELVAEVAGSAGHDLDAKLESYRSNGVREYIIWRVAAKAIDWYVLSGDEYVQLAPNSNGLLKSTIFPGLWLDAAALVASNLSRVLEVVQRGAASPEHAAFVMKLARPSDIG